MSIQRSPRVDRGTAEQLVAGKGAGPVASVLRAAAAPAHHDELAGEDAAVAAFRAAATSVAPEPVRRSVFRAAFARVLTVKAALVLAVAGSTGIVLAASEGALPVPWSNNPAVPPATTTTTTTTPPTTNAPGSDTPGARTSDGRQPPAAPDPSIAGLCTAYAAHEDKNLDNPAFRALVDAAGGKDEVAGYCEVVEAATSNAPAGPGSRPSTPGKPDDPGASGNPGQRPATPPAGRPPEPPRPGQGERPGATDPGKPDNPGKSTRTTDEPTSEPAVTKTPGSPTRGAAHAVPPSGAEPPSTGG
ncbi:hypothetical protein [Actinophytocola glycyrrhizae]|uniref:Uncharacterized protein n=1 Tax=Actinophytocola glycyrrhizae TaxID=2044873 RepID=A0ABV9S596_9PSEU